MSFQRVHRSISQSPQTSWTTSQFAPRPFPVQKPQRPPTQEEIENEGFEQNKFEAAGLQLKEQYGTITPVEQERLGVLQARMDDFWAQRMERAKEQPNLLEILIRNAQSAQINKTSSIQPKLLIEEQNLLHEQEADQIASQVDASTATYSPQKQSVKNAKNQELLLKPSISVFQPIGSDAIQLTRKRKRKPADPLKKVPLYFEGPIYEWESPKPAGGRRAEATLSPKSLSGMGSDADPNLPSGIRRARDCHTSHSFVAGHLLNADFGGPGNNAKNMTILTSKANSAMKNFDNRIKDALEGLQKVYILIADHVDSVSSLKYGININIEVSDDKWGDKPPNNYIANTLSCRATISENIDLESLLPDALPRKKEEIQRVIERINDFVEQANENGAIDNT